MKQEKRFIKIKDHIGIFDNFVDSNYNSKETQSSLCPII